MANSKPRNFISEDSDDHVMSGEILERPRGELPKISPNPGNYQMGALISGNSGEITKGRFS
jgi:hypothetical protein